jgi:putative oxidoreductase
MMKFLFSSKPFALDLALFVLRVGSAGMMMTHGWNKFMNFQDKSVSWPDPLHVGHSISLGLTVFAELFCAGFLLVGLFSRLALVPLIFLMVIAVFVIHAGDSFGDKEHAVLFLVPYTVLFFSGPGVYSLDSIRKK